VDRRLLPLGVTLMLGACASEPPPSPAAVIVPGPGKDIKAFQQDDVICRSHAATGAGYGDLSQRPAVSAPTPGSADPRHAGSDGGARSGSSRGERGAAASGRGDVSLAEYRGCDGEQSRRVQHGTARSDRLQRCWISAVHGGAG
jgi:hypothetical protein